MEANMTVTIQQLADKLQVSASTVSRSLRNDPLIHPSTRARINQAAVAAGYQGRSRRGRPRASESLSLAQPGQRPAAGGRRATIAVLMGAADMSDAQRRSNFIHMLEGITAECDRLGVLNSLHKIGEVDRPGGDSHTPLPPIITERICSGAVILGPARPDDVRTISETSPVVSISRTYPDASADAVVADNVKGTAGMVSRLADLGHRKMAFVTNDKRSSFDDERFVGFMSASIALDLDISEVRRLPLGALANPESTDALAELVRREGVTALVGANDFIAVRLIDALDRLGIRVGAQVSVTGFDNDENAEYLFRSSGRTLTTVDPNFVEMGRCAVRMVTQRLEYSAVPPLQMTVPSRLVEGATVAPNRTA